MRQVRYGVFETNSSSSHSIAVRKKGGPYSEKGILESFYVYDPESWDGIVRMHSSDMEFGRSPFAPLTTFADKAMYAIASFAHTWPEGLRQAEEAVKECVPGCRGIRYDCGYDDEGTEIDYGYVDHGSVGILQAFLEENGVSVRDFLTDSRYVVFVDGDEYNVVDKLFGEGLMHKDDFEGVYGAYGAVEGIGRIADEGEGE